MIMRFKGQFSMLIGAVAILSSCSNYEYISENDVYMQAPTEINLEEDENDLTSFNAFKAREKGVFKDEYQDSRVNERVKANYFMLVSSYSPYYQGYGMYSDYPYHYHGMGMQSLFYSGYGFMQRGFGFYSGFGFGMNAFHSPYNYYGG